MCIAIYVYLCMDLMHYMDEAWSCDMDLILYYEPYDAWYPKKQVTLLWLYHELGFHHVKKKQLFIQSLNIIPTSQPS